jgi:hypothetical protein
VLYHDAFMFRANGGSIETDKLVAYDQMQHCLVWVGIGTGVLVAQSVFLVKHLAVRRGDA